MVFQVQRAGGVQNFVLPQRNQAQSPAGAGRCATAKVQGGQVFVAHERAGVGLLGQQSVPEFSAQLQRRVQHPYHLVCRIHAPPCGQALAIVLFVCMDLILWVGQRRLQSANLAVD